MGAYKYCNYLHNLHHKKNTSLIDSIGRDIMKSLLILFFFILTATFTTSAVASSSSAVASSSSAIQPVKPHIRKACRPTPYPRLCETALSLYSSQTKRTQQELCRAAVVSSLKAAQNATSIISKLSRRKVSPYEAEVIGDCIDNLKDSVYELRRATTAIKSLNRANDVEFQVVNHKLSISLNYFKLDSNEYVLNQLSSIKTWLSAGETDIMTCTDGLSGGAGWKVRSTVKKEVKKCSVNVIRQTSNALSLISNLKYK